MHHRPLVNRHHTLRSLLVARPILAVPAQRLVLVHRVPDRRNPLQARQALLMQALLSMPAAQILLQSLAEVHRNLPLEHQLHLAHQVPPENLQAQALPRLPSLKPTVAPLVQHLR